MSASASTDPRELAKALGTLAQLPQDSFSMTYLTREVNVYLDVVRFQGERQHLSRTDLSVLFQRMLDLAQVQPVQETTDQPAVSEGAKAALVGEIAQIAPGPGKINSTPIPSDEPSPAASLKLFKPRESPRAH